MSRSRILLVDPAARSKIAMRKIKQLEASRWGTSSAENEGSGKRLNGLVALGSILVIEACWVRSPRSVSITLPTEDENRNQLTPLAVFWRPIISPRDRPLAS